MDDCDKDDSGCIDFEEFKKGMKSYMEFFLHDEWGWWKIGQICNLRTDQGTCAFLHLTISNFFMCADFPQWSVKSDCWEQNATEVILSQSIWYLTCMDGAQKENFTVKPVFIVTVCQCTN